MLRSDIQSTSLASMFFSVVVLGMGVSFVSLLILSIYRVYFHPLAKYPGPFWAKLTDWYSVYHAYHGDRHLEFHRCHEKYGPVFRYGPNSLSFNTNTSLKTIYTHRAPVQKSQFYTVFPPTKDTFNTHSSISKTQHARKRRVLSHAFSEAAIKDMEKYILQNVRVFVRRLGEKEHGIGGGEKGEWSKVQNMADWSNYLTFDVMGDLCFGQAFEMLEREENRHVIDLIGNAAHMHLILGTNPIIKTLGLNKLLFSHIYNLRMQYMSYSRSLAATRQKLGLETDRKDFFYYLLNAVDPETGKGFTTPELWGESNLLIIAGSDTTSTALAASFFYLTHNPHVLRKLEDEIRTKFADVEDIVTGKELGECTYLRAVLEESMRLSPPVGGILPREILTPGLNIDNCPIPAGTVVGTPHYALHHNPSYFPQPYEFLPERWIEDEAGVDAVALAKSAYSPFSIGPRGCIGKSLAYAELGVALARTVWVYDFRLAGGSTVGEGVRGAGWGRERRGEYQTRDSFTSLKDGPEVVFRVRGGVKGV
ncbi:hypothetical protein HYFRA_00012764 [Hymenoscyphus fraxineus]|uniref:Cytochrome P450 n=1 Tax=Hymenoscyphus fraxineus TaxID=746836 RepID=A0A9N9PN06_9HELO|nr:hypothetical protein HYFRA_00012764 [Hymenoscyphus fraxineus]